MKKFAVSSRALLAALVVLGAGAPVMSIAADPVAEAVAPRVSEMRYARKTLGTLLGAADESSKGFVGEMVRGCSEQMRDAEDYVRKLPQNANATVSLLSQAVQICRSNVSQSCQGSFARKPDVARVCDEFRDHVSKNRISGL